MKLKKFVGITLLLCVVLSGCSSKKTLDCTYSFDYFNGYRFFEDGTVIYYESHWYKKPNEPTGCKPEYSYGVYSIEDNAITITISGNSTPITGIIKDDLVVIDGHECELVTEPYYEGEKSNITWKKLDETLKLSK